MTKRALILGVAGQTGSYLAEVLLAEGYQVFGLIRRTSSQRALYRLGGIIGRLTLIQGDVTDPSSLERALVIAHPHEVYNFAAQSHVGISFTEPLHTMEVTGLGAVRVFEAIRLHTSISEHVRVYQASSSEMFGDALASPQTEETPLTPVSPYGCAKVYAHQMAHVYRQAYGMFIACGIAYNHESPRRGEEFVTRKITQAVAAIKADQQDTLVLGNLLAARDWTHARDIAVGAWRILQHPVAEDFILASGQTHTVEEFAQAAFKAGGLGEATGYLQSSRALYRPTDIPALRGDASKARHLLGWIPQVSFEALVQEMVDADCAELSDPLRAG